MLRLDQIKKRRSKKPYRDLEGEFFAAWRAYAPELPAPEPQYQFCATRKFRADFAFPPQRILVEIEGGIFAPRSGHRSISGFVANMEKYNCAAILGWRILRYHEGDLKKPQELVEQVKLALTGSATNDRGLSLGKRLDAIGRSTRKKRSSGGRQKAHHAAAEGTGAIQWRRGRSR